MNEPLGNMVGNFLEIEESLDCLEGRGPEDLMHITLELAARMVVLGGKAKTQAGGRKLWEDALVEGRQCKRSPESKGHVPFFVLRRNLR
jgi:pyrimidine-nucleoside phosphorylase